MFIGIGFLAAMSYGWYRHIQCKTELAYLNILKDHNLETGYILFEGCRARFVGPWYVAGTKKAP